MKKNTILLLVAFAALWGNVYLVAAQESVLKEQISVTPLRLEQSGDSLYIDLEIVLRDVKIKSAQAIDLIPVLLTADRSMTLPLVSLKGNNEYAYYKRKTSLMTPGEKQARTAPYAIEKGKQWTNNTLHYQYSLPYEEWMAGASVEMRYDDCGCGETATMYTQPVGQIVLPRKVEYQVVPHLAYIQPEAEAVKRREVQVEAFLDFAVNKTNIRPDYMNNPRELDKIRQMIDGLQNDESITINGLDIIGYASPEGSLANNKRLSEGRAKALRDYLASRYDFSSEYYNIVFGGENWDGLIAALDIAKPDYGSQVIGILANDESEAVRKQKIKALRGGQPYRQMLQDIYPALRVAVCKVNFEVKNFDLNEAKEMIRLRPQNLSLNEMFLVANTYPKGSPQFIEVFETAARLYPGSEVANLNAAASSLSENDVETAANYLSKVEPQTYPAAYNNLMGALYMLRKEYETAERYLKIAQTGGVEEAGFNLQEIEKTK
ncbi:DUF3868 domain-containing protein [Bacteroides sp. 51]|nr:DUF3868 domain-containing protein [Bacteroides sp. 51]